VLLTTTTRTTPVAVLVLGYVLFGTGFGLVNTPITNTAVSGMPRAQAGVSAAIASTGRQIGNTLGVAILGSVVAAHLPAPVGWWILAGCGALVAALGVLTTTRPVVPVMQLASQH
jgi:hypothetical protein